MTVFFYRNRVCNCRIQGLLVKKLRSYCPEREEELVSVCHRVKNYTDPRLSKSEFILACWYFRFVGCFFFLVMLNLFSISQIFQKSWFWSELLGIEFFGISRLTIWCRRCHSPLAKDDLQRRRKCYPLSKGLCGIFLSKYQLAPNFPCLKQKLSGTHIRQ